MLSVYIHLSYILQVATKTNNSAGDGTTTAIVLAREVFRAGLLSISYGACPASLKRGMDKTVKELLRILKAKSVAVKGSDDIKGVISLAFIQIGSIFFYFYSSTIYCFFPSSFQL